MKSYKELILIDNYNDRLEYLYIGDKIGNETFGSSRWINQKLYSSPEWKRIRDIVILRDMGCDLGVEGCDLNSKNIIVHHINPITENDIINASFCVFDENNLISTSRRSHNYIHYGNKQLDVSFERKPNDTCPWRR